MCKTAHDAYWPSIGSFVIDFFQVLSFLFPLPTEHHEIYESFGWQPFLDWLSYFSNALKIYPYLNLVTLLVLFLIAMVMVVGIVSISIFVAGQFSMNSFKTMWTIVFLRAVAGIYIP